MCSPAYPWSHLLVHGFKMEGEEAVYRVKDNLQYFFIKVELRRVTTTRNIGHVLGETGQLLSSTRQSSIGLSSSITNQQEYEELTYGWQQKYFSQREEELFADGNNCSTALECRYHQQILTLRNEGGRPNQRLYCCTDVDSIPVSEDYQPIIVGGREVPTFATQQSGLRKRRPHRAATSSPSPVCEQPTQRERAGNRMTTASSQSMYLMADLRHLDGVDEEDEHVLCHITLHSDGVMTLKPDVTKNQPWYRLESRHREIYEYRLVHVSEGMTPGERRKEWRLKNELIQRHASHIESNVGEAFIEPPADEALRVAVYGSIESAHNFEYNDLYVTMELELPKGGAASWSVEEEEENGVVITQLCRTKSTHETNMAHFSCPFEFQLIQYNDPDKLLHGCPRFLIEVASLDFWDRHRIEGYGHFNLPSSPGVHSVLINTWRPTGHRLMDKMRRFFIGGGPELEDLSYIAQPSDFNGTHLVKYGLHTESTGSVSIKLNIVHQSSRTLDKARADQLAKSLKYKGLGNTTAGVLDAYRRARQKALQVTGGTL